MIRKFLISTGVVAAAGVSLYMLGSWLWGPLSSADTAPRQVHPFASSPQATTRNPHPSAHVVVPTPAAPLPAVHPAPVRPPADPALAVFVDRAAAQRLPVDFPARVPVLTDHNDIAWVIAVLHDRNDLDAIRNEAANLLRRSQVAHLDDHFIAILDDLAEKERFASYTVQHLAALLTEHRNGTAADALARAAAIRQRLRTALTDPRLMVRSEALLALTREREPTALAIIRRGLGEPTSGQPQDLLIRCAKEANLTDLIPAIRPLAYAENQVVRIAAVNVLAQWQDDASYPAFEEASRSSVPRLQRAGVLALSLMEGQR